MGLGSRGAWMLYAFEAQGMLLRMIMSSPVFRFAAGALVFCLAIYISHRVGVPQDSKGSIKLPSVALDWRLLFHVERAAALVGAAGAVLLIAWNGAHGIWPTKFANLEYAPKETAEVTAKALDELGGRLHEVEKRTGIASTDQ